MIRRIGLGAKPLGVAHNDDRDTRVGADRRPSCVADDVQNATRPGRGEEDREQITEAGRRQVEGDLKRVRGIDVYAQLKKV